MPSCSVFHPLWELMRVPVKRTDNGCKRRERISIVSRRGSFVVIDHTGKEKAQESGSKITSIVCKVLYYEQIRLLQKSPEWPEIFRDIKTIPADESSQIPITQEDGGGEIDLSDESIDSMPPLKQTQKD